MNNKVNRTLNFNGNIFQLRDKLMQDQNLKWQIYNIHHRSIHIWAPTTMTTSNTITSKKTPSSNTSFYKARKLQSLRDNLISSRMNFQRLQTEDIERRNSNLKDRLKRVSSPLSRQKMNQSYYKIKQYEKISKRVRENKEVKKRETNVLRRLPILYIRGRKITAY